MLMTWLLYPNFLPVFVSRSKSSPPDFLFKKKRPEKKLAVYISLQSYFSLYSLPTQSVLSDPLSISWFLTWTCPRFSFWSYLSSSHPWLDSLSQPLISSSCQRGKRDKKLGIKSKKRWRIVENYFQVDVFGLSFSLVCIQTLSKRGNH